MGVSVKGFKACPFCGARKDLRITSEETYNELVAEHGSACISLDCECGAKMYQFSGGECVKYSAIKTALRKKWNERKKEG